MNSYLPIVWNFEDIKMKENNVQIRVYFKFIPIIKKYNFTVLEKFFFKEKRE
jgi:hypothetical protein